MVNLFDRGLEFFNRGHYFEAHEAWEDLWRETHGPSRLFVQGLIQAAVGMHHLSHGNRTGARGQLKKSMSKLAQYSPGYAGIDNARLMGQLQEILEDLKPRPLTIVRLNDDPL